MSEAQERAWSELAPHYVGCDVFVLPSFVETQGLVALEAMHFGKPLLVSRVIVSATELVEEVAPLVPAHPAM